MTTYTVTVKTIKDNETHKTTVNADNKQQAAYIVELLFSEFIQLIKCEVTK